MTDPEPDDPAENDTLRPRSGPDQKGESVFKSTPAPQVEQKTEHVGVHGEPGRENDLDRAEEAGREGGRR